MLAAAPWPNKCDLCRPYFNEWTRVDFGANLLRFHLVVDYVVVGLLVDYVLWLLRNYDLIVFRVACLFPWLTLIRIPLWFTLVLWNISNGWGMKYLNLASFNFTLQLVRRINLSWIKSRYRDSLFSTWYQRGWIWI